MIKFVIIKFPLFNISEYPKEGQPRPSQTIQKEDVVNSATDITPKELFDEVIRNNQNLKQFFLDNVIYGNMNGSFFDAIESNAISFNRFFLECHYARKGDLEENFNDDFTALESIYYQAIGQAYPYVKKIH